MSASPPLLQGKVSLNFARASDRVGAAGLSPAKPERGKVWKPIQGIGVKRQYRDKMTARDSRRDCRIGSSLSLRERDLGVRAQSLLNPDAEVKDIPTLTPALSRRERAGVRVGISLTSASGFRRDCALTPKSLSRRERDDPIRQSLLESRAVILSRYCRLTPMPWMGFHTFPRSGFAGLSPAAPTRSLARAKFNETLPCKRGGLADIQTEPGERPRPTTIIG